MKIYRESNVLIITLDSVADYANASQIKSDIRDFIKESDRHVILDLTHLTFMDSSGVGVLISVLKSVDEMEGTLSLANPSDDIRFVLTMTKIEKLIPIYASVQEAKLDIPNRMSSTSEA